MATIRFRAPVFGLLASCGVLMLAACAAGSKSGPGDRFVVSARQSQFYKNGPAQAFGPDAVLPPARKLTMLKREFGFSQVRLENNETGYVATDELMQLPPEKATPKPMARRLAPALRAGSAGARPRSQRQPAPPLPHVAPPLINAHGSHHQPRLRRRR